MPKFTNRELTDMHSVYCNGSASAAERGYRRRFPNRRMSGRQTFIDVHRNLSDHSSFQRVCGLGRPLKKHNWENVLNSIENDPQVSLRMVSRIPNVHQVTVKRIN